MSLLNNAPLRLVWRRSSAYSLVNVLLMYGSFSILSISAQMYVGRIKLASFGGRTLLEHDHYSLPFHYTVYFSEFMFLPAAALVLAMLIDIFRGLSHRSPFRQRIPEDWLVTPIQPRDIIFALFYAPWARNAIILLVITPALTWTNLLSAEPLDNEDGVYYFLMLIAFLWFVWTVGLGLITFNYYLRNGGRFWRSRAFWASGLWLIAFSYFIYFDKTLLMYVMWPVTLLAIAKDAGILTRLYEDGASNE